MNFNDIPDTEEKQTPIEESSKAIAVEDITAFATKSPEQDKESGQNENSQIDALTPEVEEAQIETIDANFDSQTKGSEAVDEINSEELTSMLGQPDIIPISHETGEDVSATDKVITEVSPNTAALSTAESSETPETPATAEVTLTTDTPSTTEAEVKRSEDDFEDVTLSRKKSKKSKKKQRSAQSADPEETYLASEPPAPITEPPSTALEQLSPLDEAQGTTRQIESVEPTARETTLVSETPEQQIIEEIAEESADHSTIVKKVGSKIEKQKRKGRSSDKSDTFSQEIPVDSATDLVSPRGEVHLLTIEKTDDMVNPTEHEINPTDKSPTKSAIDEEEKEPENELEFAVDKKSKKKKKKLRGVTNISGESSSIATPQELATEPVSVEEPNISENLPEIQGTEPMQIETEPITLDVLDGKGHPGIVDEQLQSAYKFPELETEKVDEVEFIQPSQVDPELGIAVSDSYNSPDRLKEVPTEPHASERLVINPEQAEPKDFPGTDNILKTAATLTEDPLPKDADVEPIDELPTYNRKPSKKEKKKQQAAARNSSYLADAVITDEATENLGEERNLDLEMANDQLSAHHEASIQEREEDISKKSSKKNKGSRKQNKATTLPQFEVIPEASNPPPTTGASENIDSQELEPENATTIDENLRSKEDIEETVSQPVAEQLMSPNRRDSLTRKKSKKAKGKKNDPSKDTILDDDTLWEGPRPEPHEELKSTDDLNPDNFQSSSTNTVEHVPRISQSRDLAITEELKSDATQHQEDTPMVEHTESTDMPVHSVTISTIPEDSKHVLTSPSNDDSQNVREETGIEPSPANESDPNEPVHLQELARTQQQLSDLSDRSSPPLKESTNESEGKDGTPLEEQNALDGVEVSGESEQSDEQSKEQENVAPPINSDYDEPSYTRRFSFEESLDDVNEPQPDGKRFSFEKGLPDVADVRSINIDATAPKSPELAEEQLPETEVQGELSQKIVDRQLTTEDIRAQEPPNQPLVDPISPAKFALLGTPALPSVKEEDDAQVEAENVDLTLKRHFHDSQDPNRDSGFITDSPIPHQNEFPHLDERVRDSGVHLREWSPVANVATRAVHDPPTRLSSPSVSWQARSHKTRELENEEIEHQNRKTVEVADHHHSPVSSEGRASRRPHEDKGIARLRRTPTITSSQQQDKRSRHEKAHSPDTRQLQDDKGKSDLHRNPTIREPHRSPHLGHEKSGNLGITESSAPRTPKTKEYAELDRSLPMAQKPHSGIDFATAAGAGLAGASIAAGIAASQARHSGSDEWRPDSAQSSQSRRSANTNRLRTPDPKLRPESVGSSRSLSSGTPPLRRSDRRVSGDLRSLSQQSQRSSQHSKSDLAKEAAVTPTPTLHPANPTANEGRVRTKDMADVYVSPHDSYQLSRSLLRDSALTVIQDGFGEGRIGSPRSPTRPPSMRRRQSLQVLDLEARVDQLARENRMLTEANTQAETSLRLTQRAAADLADRDAEIDSLKATINWLHAEVTRLSEVNDGLTSANVTLGNQENDRYGALERQHAETSRELEEMREAHHNLATGMDGIVANQVQTTTEEKDNEIAQLRAELEAAKETIREMQQQILEAKPNDSEFLTVRDEDYFDLACQQLCQHVQQWVLRFSKFSDMRACRLTSEINNDKIIDRLDNAILDGSDVDSYLADRVRRRDVFMSMTMTMIWEFVFTRYLFGMDREQRQKLKSVEKLLSEVGPPAAVHQWRATTLTLLSKREAFRQQRVKDTEAVVNEILKSLFAILPPPSHLEEQIQHQLTRVMRAAVDLSIEMRTQRAEYMMLPPLQPEYDANGDLATKVTFNAALMNERSGNTLSNEELEAQNAVVRIVLFPLVVKKGDDSGAGDEEIVVCPAQVLVANDRPRRVVSGESNDSSMHNNSRISMQSGMPADI
ncbi:hypothetical protein B7463_g7559, partial [Scytalidium lignicola]